MKIKMLVMDVDGTLTDGRIFIGANGEMMKSFDVKDGYAVAHMLPELGIAPVIITGRRSEIVAQRAKELGVTELYQGVSDKLAQLRSVAAKFGVQAEEIAYIGDDVNDLTCIQYCGLSACPQDAVGTIKAQVDVVCRRDGGRGAVREFIARIGKDLKLEENHRP